MSYPINYPTPQGANVQIFTANTNASVDKRSATWVKPQGASMVWFTLIGPGGKGGNATGDGTNFGRGGGGGSGAVTNCMMPAFLVPDRLNVIVYPGSSVDTAIYYQQKNGTGYLLLEAQSGSSGGSAVASGGDVNAAGGNGGTASNSNYFSAAGFFQSVAGQDGSDGDINQTTSTTTFLQGGVGGSGSQAASQYGYSKASLTSTNRPGYGIISPILVSVACNAAGNDYTTAASASEVKNGFGCGGGGAGTSVASLRYGTNGGDGLCVIITW